MTMLTECFGLSVRRACGLVGLWRSTWQYRPHRADDSALRGRLRELAEQRRRFGAPRLYVLLRREGFLVNHKRTERLYREEGLALRRRRHRKRAAGVRVTLRLPTRPSDLTPAEFAKRELRPKTLSAPARLAGCPVGGGGEGRQTLPSPSNWLIGVHGGGP